MQKAIVFDMDGVIFDTENLARRCWQEVADRYGYGDMTHICAACTGTNSVLTEQIFLSYMGKDFPYKKRKQEASERFRSYTRKNGMPVKNGVSELFSYLRSENFRIGLASSTRIATVKDELAQAGLIRYFDSVTGGDEIERSKPDPDIYLTACKKLGVQPSDAYAVEDSYNGVRSAAGAGMRVLMVPDLLPATEEMKRLTVSVQDSLIGIIAFLKSEGL